MNETIISYIEIMMKSTFILFFLIVSLGSFSQKGKFNPFKPIVLKPDTAIIDKSLTSDLDSVQSNYLKRYYHAIQEMEELVNSKNFPDDPTFKKTQEKLKPELAAAKKAEPEIKKFKYYQTLLW